jgi:hypothetical protein
VLVLCHGSIFSKRWSLHQSQGGSLLVSRLQQAGISDEAIDGVLARLHEVQGGMITGAAYPGDLVGGPPQWWGTIPKPIP